jgi:chromate transporter
MTDGQPILGDPASPPVHLTAKTEVITPREAPVESPTNREGPPRYTLAELGLYFLTLGTLGFGGPIALVGAMRRDLVERRRWVSETDYAEGLALTQLAPGPLAAQLAIDLKRNRCQSQ